MTDRDLCDLEVPRLDPILAARIRARGRRAIQTRPAGIWAEASLVGVFAVGTLLWAAAAVLHLA